MASSGQLSFGDTHFRLIRTLGAGSSGIVYEAYDEKADSIVALKELQRMDGQSLYRFKREFRELADIRHPNLLRLGALYHHDDRWFFTMELVSGNNFFEYVRGPRSSISPVAETEDYPDPAHHSRSAAVGDRGSARANSGFDESRLRLALTQLASGIHALHGQGRLHRDIKPANTVVTEDGRVVLLDFGLIQRFGPGQTVASCDDIAGTAAYMAPEQAASSAVGPAADWYAVGVMLFEALTGRLPFAGKPMQILLDKQHSEATPTSRMVGDVPADLDALCAALLRLEPQKRPHGDEILRELERRAPATTRPRQRPDSAAEIVAPDGPFVGRRAELAALDGALAKTRAGTQTAVLLAGPAGVGKSAIADAFVRKQVLDNRATVVLRGRAYQQETVPFKAFDAIVDSLSHYLVRLDDVIAAALLPPGVALIASVFPVLHRVPVVARITPVRRGIEDPALLRERAFLGLRQLFDAVALRVPLILLIDDLQWADADSWRLLEALLAPPDAPPFLLLATARSSSEPEAGPREALASALPASLRQHFVVVPVGGLIDGDARELLTVLSAEAGALSETKAASIINDAEGHPLFLQELLRCAALGQEVDDQRVGLEHVLCRRLAALDDEAQRLMEVIAIAGIPLPLSVLAGAAGVAIGTCRRWIRALVDQQLVRMSSGDGDSDVEAYHDRVREAIVKKLHATTYEYLDTAGISRVHLAIGHGLLAAVSSERRSRMIGTIADHFSQAQLDSADDRVLAARLHLEAGRKAKLTTAYDAAAANARAGLQALASSEDGGVGQHFDLAFDLHMERIECEYLRGEQTAAEAAFAALSQSLADPLQSARLHILWVELLTSSGHFVAALAAARRGLRVLGIKLPERGSDVALLREYFRLRWSHRGCQAGELLGRPECDDPRITAAHELLTAMAPAGFFADQRLMSLGLMRIARLSLRHGMSAASAFGFAGYGLVLAGGFARYRAADAFGQLGQRLNRRFQERSIAPKLHFISGTYLMPWVRPYREAIEELTRAQRVALEVSDTAYEGYTAGTLSVITMAEGQTLAGMQAQAEQSGVITRLRRARDMSALVDSHRRFCLALRGLGGEPTLLGSDNADDQAFCSSLSKETTPVAIFYYHYLRAELCYLFDDHEQAERLLVHSDALTEGIFGIVTAVEHTLFHVLVAAQLHAAAGMLARRRLRTKIKRWLGKLDRWAKECPENFAARQLLAHAEFSRIRGDDPEATVSRYRQAVTCARKFDEPKREAMALERLVRFANDHNVTIEEQMDAVCAAYERWGASAKVQQLRQQHSVAAHQEIS